jgi:hypothetical protein
MNIRKDSADLGNSLKLAVDAFFLKSSDEDLAAKLAECDFEYYNSIGTPIVDSSDSFTIQSGTYSVTLSQSGKPTKFDLEIDLEMIERTCAEAANEEFALAA